MVLSDCGVDSQIMAYDVVTQPTPNHHHLEQATTIVYHDSDCHIISDHRTDTRTPNMTATDNSIRLAQQTASICREPELKIGVCFLILVNVMSGDWLLHCVGVCFILNGLFRKFVCLYDWECVWMY